MKKLLFTAVIASIVFISCKEETTTNPTPTPKTYSIEGMWVLESTPNTAYIFEDGLRYTVYCTSADCDWDTVTIEDAIPNPKDYTFENDTLKVDLDFGNSSTNFINFVCDGNVVKQVFESGDPERWFRPSYNISGCNE